MKIETLEYRRDSIWQIVDLLKFFVENENASIAKDSNVMEEEKNEETTNDYYTAIFDFFVKCFLQKDSTDY